MPRQRKTDQGRDPLRRYRQKRDFSRTEEPEGSARAGGTARSVSAAQRAANGPIFVVQEHAARRLHYDVRLEADGVLKSWAVPKGPSADPGVKRLAVRTEDHPIEYAEFEGVIPAGEYGGGEVIVWDTGTYSNLTARRGKPVAVADAVEGGHVAVWLEGRKLRGGYAFTRLPAKPEDRGSASSWLMVKMRDEAVPQMASSHALETAASVRTGRTVADLAADPSAARWRSNDRDATSRPGPAPPALAGDE